MADDLSSTAVVPMPPPFHGGGQRHAARLPTPLQDRNLVLDEIVQLKQEMKVLQLETRRVSDELRHRVGTVDARLQAGEANARAYDKREADHFDTCQQQKQEVDSRLKEVLEEMMKLRRETESDVQGLNQETRNEIRERDAHVQQLDALARTLAGRLKAVEADRAEIMDSVMAEMDRRLKLIQDDGKRQQQQQLERLMVLERIIQRETEERQKGDIDTRQEMSSVLLAVKAVSKQEATHRLGMQRELRAEVQDVSKVLQEQARTMHDNAQLSQARMQDQLQEEKVKREEDARAVQRQVDSFARNYENERQRLSKTVHDAVTHMSERTASAQTISKRLQEESTEVKRLALKLQEEAAFGLKNLAEKVEEGLRTLRAAQDRQAAQMVDVKDDVHSSLREQREKTTTLEGRLQTELTRSVTEERAAREVVLTRLRDCEELTQQMERKVWSKHTRLEELMAKGLDGVKKENDDRGSKLLAATGELRSAVYDQRQRLHALELSTDLRMSRALSDLRTQHAKVEGSVDQNRQQVADMRRAVDAQQTHHSQRLAAVESALRDHVNHTSKQFAARELNAATITIQHAQVGRGADEQLVAPAPGETGANLSFLDMRMDAPMSSPDKPLKKLEFKDVAPPQRPESPAYVRSSPIKPPVETQTAGDDTAGGDTAGGDTAGSPELPSPELPGNPAGPRLKSFDELGEGLAAEKEAGDEGELKHVAPLQGLEAGGEAVALEDRESADADGAQVDEKLEAGGEQIVDGSVDDALPDEPAPGELPAESEGRDLARQSDADDAEADVRDGSAALPPDGQDDGAGVHQDAAHGDAGMVESQEPVVGEKEAGAVDGAAEDGVGVPSGSAAGGSEADVATTHEAGADGDAGAEAQEQAQEPAAAPAEAGAAEDLESAGVGGEGVEADGAADTRAQDQVYPLTAAEDSEGGDTRGEAGDAGASGEEPSSAGLEAADRGDGTVSPDRPGEQGKEAEDGEEDEEVEQSEADRAQMEALEPDVRRVISKARLGRTSEFKELINGDPTLLTRAVDAHGNTLLHIASSNGKRKIVKELLRQWKERPDQIDVYARNLKGQNAVDCALEFNFSELADYLREKHPRLSEELPPSAEVDTGAGAAQETPLDTPAAPSLEQGPVGTEAPLASESLPAESEEVAQDEAVGVGAVPAGDADGASAPVADVEAGERVQDGVQEPATGAGEVLGADGDPASAGVAAGGSPAGGDKGPGEAEDGGQAAEEPVAVSPSLRQSEAGGADGVESAEGQGEAQGEGVGAGGAGQIGEHSEDKPATPTLAVGAEAPEAGVGAGGDTSVDDELLRQPLDEATAGAQ